MVPSILTPHIEGTAPIRSTADKFMLAFERRVQTGLLIGRPHPRSIYRALQMGPHHLHVGAASWWTAINVGLNELDVQVIAPGAVHYRVWYWRWARFVLALSGSLGVIGLLLIQIFDVRRYIAEHPDTMIPGLSVDHNLQVAWSMVVFWGFVAPWLIIAAHKRPLRRLVERLIGEVDRSTADVKRNTGS